MPALAACRSTAWCLRRDALSEGANIIERRSHVRHQGSRPRTPEDGERAGFHRQHRRARTGFGYLHRRPKGVLLDHRACRARPGNGTAARRRRARRQGDAGRCRRDGCADGREEGRRHGSAGSAGRAPRAAAPALQPGRAPRARRRMHPMPRPRTARASAACPASPRSSRSRPARAASASRPPPSTSRWARRQRAEGRRARRRHLRSFHAAGCSASTASRRRSTARS